MLPNLLFPQAKSTKWSDWLMTPCKASTRRYTACSLTLSLVAVSLPIRCPRYRSFSLSSLSALVGSFSFFPPAPPRSSLSNIQSLACSLSLLRTALTSSSLTPLVSSKISDTPSCASLDISCGRLLCHVTSASCSCRMFPCFATIRSHPPPWIILRESSHGLPRTALSRECISIGEAAEDEPISSSSLTMGTVMPPTFFLAPSPRLGGSCCLVSTSSDLHTRELVGWEPLGSTLELSLTFACTFSCFHAADGLAPLSLLELDSLLLSSSSSDSSMILLLL
mmetsp:Transcript_8498/g.28485  ORF Transcript_8498/g.28485 Transcript_8498/m.28485 type:complete len:280 (+) Transcript_8498:443-1282(+)